MIFTDKHRHVMSTCYIAWIIGHFSEFHLNLACPGAPKKILIGKQFFDVTVANALFQN